MNGSKTVIFQINNDNITIKNLTIKNGNFDPYYSFYFIYVNGRDAKILNCNFIDNQGHNKGVIYFETETNGAVTNCTFINNHATDNSWGGAIYFNTYGTVTNCYFSGNNALNGDDIYSSDSSVTADSCIFKDGNTNFGVQIVSPTLNVEDFTAIYNSGDKLTFDLKTNGNMSIDNGNISIKVYHQNNGSEAGEYSCLSGQGWAVNLPIGSYYALFNTEYAGFEKVNRTITILPDEEFYINITSLTTDNKTVTIAAISNIPKDIIGNVLQLIVSNGERLNATYDADGTWWVTHTFGDYGTYNITAESKIKNVAVNNATLTINKPNSTVVVEDIALDWGETTNVTLTAEGATGIKAMIADRSAEVIDNYTILIPVLAAGNYTLAVTTIPDGNHSAVTRNATITVRKIDSTLTVNDIAFDYKSSGEAQAAFTNALRIIAEVVNQPQAIVHVNGTNITVSNLDAGTYTLRVTTIVDENHSSVAKTVNITVYKLKTEMTANAVVATYNVNRNLVITLKDGQGNVMSGAEITVQLKNTKVYKTDKNGQVTVPTEGLDPNAYDAKITFNGDANYEKSAKSVKVTVKKATPKLTAKKKTFKRTVKTKKYSITLKTNMNKVMKGIKVTLKVNKKTYSAKTNKKGVATFKITKLAKKGKYAATVKFKGNKYYTAKTAKPKITVK